MGSLVEEERELEFDVEETIFVAVSKRVEESKTTLFWAVQNFAGKRICVLHVHQSHYVAELSESLDSGFLYCLVAGKKFLGKNGKLNSGSDL
jgi:hypothetical protein